MKRLTHKERENLLKLDLLEALCRSQGALADILESVARQTGEAPEAARTLRRHVKLLARYQRALAEKIIGIRVNRLVRGLPGKVWLAGFVRGPKK